MRHARTSRKRTGTISLLAKAAIFVGASFAAVKLAKKGLGASPSMRGKVALITGSRGLGLAIARELGRRGVRIALCARDEQELRRACASLSLEQIEASPFPADVCNASEIAPLVKSVLGRFGRIDILVNNAGEITVGPFDTFAHTDFKHAMDLMFWAPVNLTFEVLPIMRQQRSGHIVNITSVGGRVSIPHLLPYSCAKFALVGFSTGLSSELRSQHVHVLTVVPGLMRTGSHLHAFFKGKAGDEFAWFGVLGNMPGFSVAADYAASSIVNALGRRRYVCIISLPAKILTACDAVLPETTRSILAAVNRLLLPRTNGSNYAREGSSLNATLGKTFQALTVLGRRAASDLNQ
jgi:short-subunit dehydrogenase